MGSVPLQRVAIDLDLPTPAALQRRAAAVVDGLAAGSDARLVSTRSGPLDLVEALRTPLLMALAEYLQWYELIVRAGPSAGSRVTIPTAAPRLLTANRVVGRLGGVPLELEPKLPTYRYRARSDLYNVADRVRRLLRRRRAGDSSRTSVLLVTQATSLVKQAARLRDAFADEDLDTALLPFDPTADALSAWRGPVVSVPARPSSQLTAVRAVRRLVRTQPRSAPAADVPPALVRRSISEVFPFEGARAVELADSTAVATIQDCELVVALNPYTSWGRTAAMLARSAGVPTATIEHGSIFPADAKWEHAPVDVVCVHSEASREALADAGMEGTQIEVTGRPTRATKAERGEAPPRSVVVATSGAGDRVNLLQHLRCLEQLRDAVAATPEIPWTIKLHPKDPVDLYRQTGISTLPNARIVDPHQSGTATLDELLVGAAALVTVTSTAALDAASAGVPVVVLEAAGSDDASQVPFLAATAGAVVGSAAGLADAVRRVWAGDTPPNGPADLTPVTGIDDPGSRRTVSTLARARMPH